MFVPLKPIKGFTTLERVANKSAILPSCTALSPITPSNSLKVHSTSSKENTNPKESHVPKPKTLNENSIVYSKGWLKQAIGPWKPPAALAPEKAAGSGNATSPKKSPTIIARGAGCVLADLSNTDANPVTLPSFRACLSLTLPLIPHNPPSPCCLRSVTPATDNTDPAS